MAHDVRSPLTALTLTLGVIERAGVEDERARRALGRAQAALSQTTKIIEGLLDFARSGARPEMTGAVSVLDVATQVSTVMQPRCRRTDSDSPRYPPEALGRRCRQPPP
jgi:signal transduction histidine kinase